jgi:putative inorganic carbon (hco3(-)) transporter
MAVDPARNVTQADIPVGRAGLRSRAGRAFAALDESRSSGLAFGLFMMLIVFTLLSVPSRFPVIGMARPTVLLVVVITAVILLSSGVKKDRDSSKTTFLLSLFIFYMLIAIPFVQWPGSVMRFGIENFIKVVVFFYFTVQLVDTFPRLRLFVMTVLACQVWRVLEPLYLNVTTGYWGSQAHMSDWQFMARLSGAPSDIINPNGLAFVILTALPFLHYVLGGSSRMLARVLYAALAPMLLYAFVLTGSRSGLVGLLVVVGMIIYKSRYRVTLTAIAMVAAVLLVGVMSPEMKDRYVSLVDVETQHGATREGRLQGIKQEFVVGMRRPIFGHGLGTSREALVNFAGRNQISHNLYTEVFIETGFVGFVIFMAILASILSNVRAISPAIARLEAAVGASRDGALRIRCGFYRRCGDATLTWVAMCLVFSLAAYGLSNFYWYMIAGLSVCLLNLVTREQITLLRTGAMQIPAPTPGTASGSR